MYEQSFWKKHANDSDWVSSYIELNSSTSLSAFTSTVVGSGTVAITNTGAQLITSAALGDSIQYQFSVAQIIAQLPKVPTAQNPAIYEYEMEFIIAGQVNYPQGLQGFVGFCIPDTTILAGHTDSMGIANPANSLALKLDFFSGGIDGTLAIPAGGPNPNAIDMMDSAQHEYCLQVTPHNATQGEVKYFKDGQMLAQFGPDQINWVTLTSQYLAPAFAYQNAVAGLTASQRTANLSRIGWAVRRAS